MKQRRILGSLPREPGPLPQRTAKRPWPLRRAVDWTAISAARLVTPMTLVGFMALSIEIAAARHCERWPARFGSGCHEAETLAGPGFQSSCHDLGQQVKSVGLLDKAGQAVPVKASFGLVLTIATAEHDRKLGRQFM
jgi:hypothetical protein